MDENNPRTLLASAIRRMNPEPSTDASAVWTRRHSGRYLEIREACPNASMVDAEHREVLRLNLRNIAFVGNSQRAPEQVVKALRVELGNIRIWARAIRVVWVDDTD